MKRLLAAGVGDIYQICKVFRAGELGRRHNPEFSLLEWYRIGMDYEQLMREVEALIRQVLPGGPSVTLTVAQAFAQIAGIDLFSTTAQHMREVYFRKTGSEVVGLPQDDWDAWFSLLIDQIIEPALAHHPLLFLHQFPPSQASLSRLEVRGHNRVALRFECYINGIEIANGFQELLDGDEQRARFQQQLQRRDKNQQPIPPLDEYFLAALESNRLPHCAGVALGIDRLLMSMLNACSINEVLAFGFERA